MNKIDSFKQIYLYRDHVDMRKQINGLAMIVLDELELSFETGSLFVFVSRCGKKLKMLYWDRTGFALWYKKLEKQKFHWPCDHDEALVSSSSKQLQQLLYGFEVFQKPHKILQYRQIG